MNNNKYNCQWLQATKMERIRMFNYHNQNSMKNPQRAFNRTNHWRKTDQEGQHNLNKKDQNLNTNRKNPKLERPMVFKMSKLYLRMNEGFYLANIFLISIISVSDIKYSLSKYIQLYILYCLYIISYYFYI